MSGVLAHGARLVSSVRGNALDLLVCNTRDCFGSVGGQYPVDAYTGERSDLCFDRRHVGKGNTTKAFINTDVLVEALKGITATVLKLAHVRGQWTVMLSFGFGQRASIDSVRGYLRKSDWFGSRPPPGKHADVS